MLSLSQNPLSSPHTPISKAQILAAELLQEAQGGQAGQAEAQDKSSGPSMANGAHTAHQEPSTRQTATNLEQTRNEEMISNHRSEALLSESNL